MELHRFFSLVAVCFGLVGSVFLAKGIIFLRPKNMLRLTSPYSRLAYAPEQIDSLAAQKTDALVGVIIIFLAFLTQLVSLIVIEADTPFIKTRWVAFLAVLGIISIMTIISYYVGKKFHNDTELEIGKIAIRDYSAERFAGVIDLVDVKSFEIMSQDLINIRREASETKIEFLKRIAKYVGWTIPEGIDFSKIVDNDNDG